jgi:hypothetical protein
LRRALQALIKSVIPLKEVKFDKNTFEGITQDGRGGIFDLACTDENDNHFIVEMQYGDAPYFVQRMKFYALHKFNAMVKRGKFDYGTLTKNLLCSHFGERHFAPPSIPYRCESTKRTR